MSIVEFFMTNWKYKKKLLFQLSCIWIFEQTAALFFRTYDDQNIVCWKIQNWPKVSGIQFEKQFLVYVL